MHLEIMFFSHLFLAYNNFLPATVNLHKYETSISKRNVQKYATTSNYPQDGSASIIQNNPTKPIISTTCLSLIAQTCQKMVFSSYPDKTLTIQQLAKQ